MILSFRQKTLTSLYNSKLLILSKSKYTTANLENQTITDSPTDISYLNNGYATKDLICLIFQKKCYIVISVTKILFFVFIKAF